MLTAVLMLVVLWKYWQIQRASDLGLHEFGELPKQWSVGFFAGGLLVFAMVGVYFLFSARLIDGSVPWKSVPGWLAGLTAIGILEELLFRGLLFTYLIRGAQGGQASIGRVFFVTIVGSAFFSTVHFLKAPDLSGVVTWFSGIETWAAMLGVSTGNFQLDVGGDKVSDLLRWASLFFFGVMLCVVTYKCGNLWLTMGLHTGAVFFFKFSKSFTDQVEWPEGASPWWNIWFQGDMMRGFSAILLMVLVTFVLIFIPWSRGSGGSYEESSS